VKVPCTQFHQHFISRFWARFLLSKNYQQKLYKKAVQIYIFLHRKLIVNFYHHYEHLLCQQICFNFTNPSSNFKGPATKEMFWIQQDSTNILKRWSLEVLGPIIIDLMTRIFEGKKSTRAVENCKNSAASQKGTERRYL
jgi:hypothetical protein